MEPDAGVTSAAVLAALRDKQPYCGVDGEVFAPYANTSSEAYCGTGSEGGCDSFLYADGAACKGTGGWALELDGDNVYCGAVFKMGATAGWDSNTCGFEDWGYLNDCDCDDEHGELYFR